MFFLTWFGPLGIAQPVSRDPARGCEDELQKRSNAVVTHKLVNARYEHKTGGCQVIFG
jgi:hypothetical protein